LKASIAGVDQKVSGIDNQIIDYEKQIAALQAQINALNGKISSAKADRQALINLNFTVPQQIANLNAQIVFQQQRCTASGGNQVDLKIVQDNLAGFEKKLLDANNDVNTITAEISLVKSQLADLLNQNTTIYNQIIVIQENINTLKQQLPGIQNNLNKLYL
jgi:chromosome segregation ATPase